MWNLYWIEQESVLVGTDKIDKCTEVFEYADHRYLLVVFKPVLIPPRVHEDRSALWDLTVFLLMVHNVLYRQRVILQPLRLGSQENRDWCFCSGKLNRTNWINPTYVCMRDYLWYMSLLEWLQFWSKFYSLPLFCRIPPSLSPSPPLPPKWKLSESTSPSTEYPPWKLSQSPSPSTEYPLPQNWNLGRSSHFKTFQFQNPPPWKLKFRQILAL